MKFKSACAAVALTFVASASFGWDVSGVAIGAALNEAKTEMTKANPKLKQSGLNERGKETGVVATTNIRPSITRFTISSGADDEFVALTDDKSRVWFVQRIQRPGDNSNLKRDDLYAALIEKFGRPSWARFSGFEVVWELDRSNHLFDNPGKLGRGRDHSVKTPCSFEYDHISNMVPGYAFRVPAGISPTCGVLIVASAGITPDGRVAEYQLRIVDAASQFDELNADRLRTNSADAAKPSKPNI